jgi:hypothetical protein
MAPAAVDTDLATNVKKALKRGPAQPMFFAFVMKGGAGGKLIVSKAKIPPPQIAAAKKETGGSAVLKGVCFGEAGTLVFEMARPVAANVTAATKNLLKANAGLTLKVEYRVGRDDETIAESAEPDEAVPGAEGAPAAADLGAEFKARLAEWTAVIKAALAAKGPNAADIAKLLAQATALSKPGGDMPQALAKLTQCHQLATAGAAPAGQPKAGLDPAAQFKAKLAEWTPAIKAALAAKGPRAADIGKLLAQATALSKPGGDIAQALARLTECHQLATAGAAPAGQAKAGADPAAEFKAKLAEWTPAIKAALAAKGPRAADVGKLLAQANALSKPGGDIAQALAKLTECHQLATAGGAPPPDGARAAVMKRLNALAAGIKAALAGPNAARVQALVVAVNGLVKNNDFAQAGKVLDELEPLLGGAAAPPGAGGGPRVGKKVAFAQAKINWNKAKDRVRQQLEALHKKIVEEFNDPESAEAAKNLNKVLARFNDGLGDALDALYTAEEAQQPALRTRVGEIAAKYLAYVRGDPLVQHVADNPFLEVAVQETLEQPLVDLQAQLAAQ